MDVRTIDLLVGSPLEAVEKYLADQGISNYNITVTKSPKLEKPCGNPWVVRITNNQDQLELTVVYVAS